MLCRVRGLVNRTAALFSRHGSVAIQPVILAKPRVCTAFAPLYAFLSLSLLLGALDMLPEPREIRPEHATCLGKSRNDFVFVIREDLGESENGGALLPGIYRSKPRVYLDFGAKPASTVININNKDLSRES